MINLAVLSLVALTAPVHASPWKADICRTFLLAARAAPYDHVSVAGSGGVVYDHTYVGETSIAQFFADHDAAAKESHRQNESLMRSETWKPGDIGLAFGRRMFDHFLWTAFAIGSMDFLVAVQLLADLDRLAHPYWALSSLAFAGTVGGFDFPYRYLRSITLGRMHWWLASLDFRRGRSEGFAWTYHARVSETFARRLAEFHEVGPRDVFGENLRSVTAGIWRSFLAPESTRVRWVTVRVNGSRRTSPPKLDVTIEVSRTKPVDRTN